MPPKVKAPRKSKSAAAAAPAPSEPTQVAAPVSGPEPEVTTQSVADDSASNCVVDEWSMAGDFANVLTTINGLRSALTRLSSEVRDLHKRSERELKVAQKSAKKRRLKNTNRKPSGFVKPTLITDELATFLGKPVGQGHMMARTEVTREINQYIRENKLQNPDNGRHILPDKKLGKLLRVGKDDELTYFNLQKFMSPHFVKADAPTQTA